ncbi:MAG: hypothetical protein NTV40_03975 [Solirubrobacterales bacterium]|nr:hypothetical protein [Solirubrobacterales bacterium]
MKTVIEFTMHANPGHYDELQETYSQWAEGMQKTHAGLHQVLIVGDPASGLVRGIGIFDTPAEAEGLNSEETFADFNTKAAPLMAGSPERVELQLVHTFTR